MASKNPTTDDGYAAWLDKVDAITESLAGVAQSELPDWPSRVMFDDGISPDEAARHAITEIW